jgi:DNA-binding HxlR family transcriptional regulator
MDRADEAAALMARFQAANVMAADCPSRIVLQHVTSRWGGLVMIALQTGKHRFSGLRRAVGGVSERMLAQTLQQLEGDGLVERRAFDVVPPHVEYRLTPLGAEVAAHVVALARLIEDSLPQIMAHRAA